MALNTSGGTIGASSPSAGDFPANHKFYERKFLEALQPELMYDLFGDKAAIPSNNSNTIVYNKVSEFATLENSPLTEGVTPTEQTSTLSRIEASINQFGAFMTTTDRLSEESINGLTSEFTKRNGQQGARTANLVYRDGLLGGTNVRLVGAAANQDAIASGAVATTADFAFMLAAFRLAKVKPWAMMTTGSANIGTTPIAESYHCIVPVEAIPFIEALDDGIANAFQSVEEYAGQVQAGTNEFGRYGRFRFMYDTEASIVVNSNGTPQKVAQCLVFGKGIEDKAYKVVDLAGGNMQIITKPLGSGGTTDPLNQRATQGWKFKGGTFIIQDLYMFRYEFSVGDN